MGALRSGGPNNTAFDAFLCVSDERAFEKSLKRHSPLRVDTNGCVKVDDLSY